MRGIPEFNSKKQARPVISKDLETRQSYLYLNYSSLLGEYMELKELLDKLLNEQIQQQQKMLNQLEQMKLHLASMSEEPIDDKDVGEEE